MIYENAVICPNDGDAEKAAQRVLAAFPKTGEIVLIKIFDQRARPTWHSEAEIKLGLLDKTYRICDVDPTDHLVLPNSRLTKPQLAVRDRRWEILKDVLLDDKRLILFPGSQVALLAQLMIDHKVASNKLWPWLRVYWQLGQQKNALAGQFHKCGLPKDGTARQVGVLKLGRNRHDKAGHQGINIDERIKGQIKDAIRFMDGLKGWKKAYDAMLYTHFSEKIVIDGKERTKVIAARPTYGQFRYWAKKQIDVPKVLLKSAGEAKFGRDHRGLLTSTRDVSNGPGSMFQIDSTVLDILLGNRKTRKQFARLGRPTLYLVIDVYSHLIVGFHLVLSGSSWEAAMMALHHAYSDKVAYCASLGIEISEHDWPSRHLCETLIADRGAEVLSRNAAAASEQLETKLVNLPPRRADLKGLVESRFMLLHKQLADLPGYIEKREPRDVPQKHGALMTLEQLTKVLVELVLDYNRSRAIADPPSSYWSDSDRLPTPLDLWHWGCQHVGRPRLPPTDVKQRLLHKSEATISPNGLKFEGMYYVSDSEEVNRGFVRGTNTQSPSVDIRYDPRNVSEIFILPKKGLAISCKLAQRSEQFAGYSLDEVRESRKEHKAAAQQSEVYQTESRMELKEKLQAIVDEVRSGEQPPPRSTVQTPSDRKARREEHQKNRKNAAGTPTKAAPRQQPALKPRIAAPKLARNIAAEQIAYLTQLRNDAIKGNAQ